MIKPILFFRFSVFCFFGFTFSILIASNPSLIPSLSVHPTDTIAPNKTALANGHAHNDYEQETPLFESLYHGFNYIEVDIYLHQNELYVSHDLPQIYNREKTLEKLYLDPLKQRAINNNGKIYPGSIEPLYLMIDIKSNAEETYDLLKKYIQPYIDILSSFENNKNTEKAVTIILSGNRPKEKMEKDKKRWMALDGRLSDIGKGVPVGMMPIISDKFSTVFGPYHDVESIPKERWLYFKKMTDLAHAEGKRIRLWASPENKAIWKKLLNHGADIINTDKLKELRTFIKMHELITLPK